MASLNRVTLIGNVGADPEIRFMPNGDVVANIRLATTESWKDKVSGERKELTEWHRVVFYRKLADIVTEYVKKGSVMYVEGRIRTRKWTDKARQERYTTEIEANEMQMLGSRTTRSPGSTESAPPTPTRTAGGGGNDSLPSGPGFLDNEDLPFVNSSMAFDTSRVKATRTRAQRRRI